MVNDGTWMIGESNGIDFEYNKKTKSLCYGGELEVSDLEKDEVEPLIKKVQRFEHAGQHIGGNHTKESLTQWMDDYIKRNFVTVRISDTVTYDKETNTLKGEKWEMWPVLEHEIKETMDYIESLESKGIPFTGKHNLLDPSRLPECFGEEID